MVLNLLRERERKRESNLQIDNTQFSYTYIYLLGIFLPPLSVLAVLGGLQLRFLGGRFVSLLLRAAQGVVLLLQIPDDEIRF